PSGQKELVLERDLADQLHRKEKNEEEETDEEIDGAGGPAAGGEIPESRHKNQQSEREEGASRRRQPPHQAEDDRVGVAQPPLPSPAFAFNGFAMLRDELTACLRPLAFVDPREVFASQGMKGHPCQLEPVTDDGHLKLITIPEGSSSGGVSD